MTIRNTSFLGPVKKIFLIIVLAIFLILLCFIYLHHQTGHKGYHDKLIINAAGKQRMYTHMISKDASLLQALMQSKKTDQSYQSKEDIDKKILETKEGLIQVRKDFSKNLTSMQEGYVSVNSYDIPFASSIITSNFLKKIDVIWKGFDSSIDVLINAKDNNSEMIDAVTYINDNNMQLLNLSENLLQVILEDSIASDRIMEYFSYGLIGLLILIILLALFQLQRYLLLPFGQLYKGIAEIGLEYNPEKSDFLTKKKVIPIVFEISNMFKKINYLISLIENINNNDSFMSVLHFISNTFSSFIPYNYIGIALIDEEKKLLKASYGVSDGVVIGMPERIMGATWEISDTSMGELLITGEARIINDLEAYCAGRPVKPYNAIIMEAGIKASITLPLKVSGEPVGMIFFSSSQKNAYNEEHLKFLKTLANSIAISLHQNIFISDILYSSILGLTKLAEARDEGTGEHLDRMTIYSRAITELLYENNVYPEEISIEYIDNIQRFSPLHDIGKVGILDGILLKPGKLTTEEFNEMKKHTTFGAEVLRSAEQNVQKKGKSLFGMGIEIVEGHHEKWDGTGYPYGKKGTEIPLSARIVAIADVFDALTSKRPYKDAFAFETSINIIAEGREKHFDPKIVDVFMANRKFIEELYHDYKRHS